MVTVDLRRFANSKKVPEGFANALQLFHDAAKRVPAYKDFLSQNQINPAKVKTWDAFQEIPPIDKQNYITQYTLEELSWDGVLSPKFISMSSGSTGQPFFWPRGQAQDDIVAKLCQPIYENVFETRSRKTLYVNTFAIGAWIAGFELNSIAVRMGELGNRVSVITPGIDRAEALREIIRLAPSFETIILAGYPPFLRDIVLSGIEQGFDWGKYDTRLMPAGEAISESWRDYMLGLVRQKDVLRGVINVYGMAESGVVATETPASVAFRRTVSPTSELFKGHEPVGLYQYNPHYRYFEEWQDSSILLTTNAGLPLVRYNTRDRGGLVHRKDAQMAGGTKLTKLAERQELDLSMWSYPSVYLFGRRDLSASLYAVNIYPENIKAGLEQKTIVGHLSGMFVMETKFKESQEQFLDITVELAPGIKPTNDLLARIESSVSKELENHNSEYRKLKQAVGSKATPEFNLIKHGELNTVRGRKHKWVKKG